LGIPLGQADERTCLVASLRDKIGEQITGLTRGGTALPPPNLAGTLALVNVEYHAPFCPVFAGGATAVGQFEHPYEGSGQQVSRSSMAGAVIGGL
jgi:hypothetical protein